MMRTFKKLLIMTMVLTMVLNFTGCGSSDEVENWQEASELGSIIEDVEIEEVNTFGSTEEGLFIDKYINLQERNTYAYPSFAIFKALWNNYADTTFKITDDNTTIEKFGLSSNYKIRLADENNKYYLTISLSEYNNELTSANLLCVSSASDKIKYKYVPLMYYILVPNISESNINTNFEKMHNAQAATDFKYESAKRTINVTKSDGQEINLSATIK